MADRLYNNLQKVSQACPCGLVPTQFQAQWHQPTMSLLGLRCPHLNSAAAAGKQPDLKPSAVLGTDESVLARPLQPDAHHPLHLSLPGPHLYHL